VNLSLWRAGMFDDNGYVIFRQGVEILYEAFTRIRLQLLLV